MTPVTGTVSLTGGQISLGSNVTVNFPANSASEPFAVTLAPPANGFQAQGSILQIFSLNAQGLTTGQPITQFSQPLTITVSFDPTGLTATQLQRVEIDYFQPSVFAWAQLPSTVDLTSNTVSAQTTHFTDYSVIVDQSVTDGSDSIWPQSANVNNFGADPYTGSAAFNYTFDLPPGTGGLTPHLGITGSSEGAWLERRTDYESVSNGGPGLQTAGLVGIGFQLDLPYIESHNVTIPGQATPQTVWDLYFNGSSYKLIPGSTTSGLTEFRTESDQGLRLQEGGASNPSNPGSLPGPSTYWYLWTKDGTKYIFGMGLDPGVTPSHILGSFPNSPKLDYMTFQNPGQYGVGNDFTWYLSQIVDTSGNSVVIGYDSFRDPCAACTNTQGKYVGIQYYSTTNGCNDFGTHYDQAVFPSVMTYSYADNNGDHYNAGNPRALSPSVRVYFNITAFTNNAGIADSQGRRQDYLLPRSYAKWQRDPCLQAWYNAYALDSIDVTVLSSGSESLVRHYQFTYNDADTLQLATIQECSTSPCSSTTGLPKTTIHWTYYSDQADSRAPTRPLFDYVDNGYNGRVTYSYQFPSPVSSYADKWGNANPVTVPITLPRVGSRTANPGVSGTSTPAVDTYSYGTAAGNSDTVQPEFRGYSSATVTEGNKIVEHDFLQGLGTTAITLLDGTSYTDVNQMKGKEWRTVTKNSDSSIVDVHERQYQTAQASGAPSGTLLVELATDEDNRYPPSTTSLTPVPSGNMRRTTTYTYDGYGNVVQQNDSANSTLQRYSQIGYSQNLNLWILDKVYYKNVYDGFANLISNDAYYYGSNPSETSPATPTADSPGHYGSNEVTLYRRMIRNDSLYDLHNACASCTRTYYNYDAYGNRSSITDPNNNVTSTGYDATFTYPTSETFPLVGTAYAAWNAAFGKPSSSTDVNNQTTSYYYDAFGRLASVVKPGDTTSAPTITYTYYDTPSASGASDHSRKTVWQASPSPNQSRTDFYDGFGRLIESKVADESGGQTTSYQTYDGNGRLLYRSVPIESTVTTFEQPSWGSLTKTTYAYDALERPTNVQDPATGTTTTYYSAWTTESVDANNHCRLNADDFAGRVAQVTLFDGTYSSFGSSGCGATHTTTHVYDPNDHLTSVNDPAGNQTTISYDGLGRKTRIVDPDMGTWSYGYDANGNLTTQIDSRGQVSFYTYDGLNRLTGIATATPTVISAGTINALRGQINTDRANNGMLSWGWASPAGPLGTSNNISAATFNELAAALQGIATYRIPPRFTAGTISSGGTRPIRIADLIDLSSWAYGSYSPPALTPLIQYTYDQSSGGYGNGRRTTMQDQAASTTYTYDKRGRISTETRTQGSNIYTTNYTYNDADQQTTITYPDSSSEVVTAVYNVRGLPQSLVGSSTTYVSSATPVAYDPLGRATTIIFGDGTTNVSSYDSTTTRLISFAAPGITRSYGYDGLGRLTCLNPATTSPCYTTTSGAEVFGYDAFNRVTSMNNTGITDPDAYTYDSSGLGNLTTKSEGATNVSISYTGSGHVHAPASVTTNGTTANYVYDAAGNLISRGSTSYTYDWQNHLTQVNQSGSVTQFAYDGDGTLVHRIDPNGTVTDYVGDIYEKAIPTGTATPTETKRYYLGDLLVAINVGGTTSYLHQDYLHSTVSSSSATKVEYTPYGLLRTSSGTLPTDRQFQGQQNQSSVGLYHMGARWYDPTIGLWTQPDTVVPNPMDPLSLNRYSFVEGNPLRFTDPTGHADANPQCPSSDPSCQDNPQSQLANTTGDNAQQPLSGHDACDLMPLACKTIGNFAAWIYICLAGDCEWMYVPIPGAIPPPDSSSGAERPGGTSPNDNESATGASCSFSEDTPVETVNGLEPIGDLQVGDSVVAYDAATGIEADYPISAVLTHLDPVIEQITISDETIDTTPDHPFYVEGRGWTPAGELQVGEFLHRADGTSAAVRAVSWDYRPRTMFNLTVAQAHTYFVGTGHWLVHNDCGNYSVYLSRNKIGVVKYVGITERELPIREAEHQETKGTDFTIEQIPGLQGLSKNQARAIEQALIEIYGRKNPTNKFPFDIAGQLLNRYNSIDPNRGGYYEAWLEYARTKLQAIGFDPWSE
jgi:RHS repeat-associated protein